MLPRPNPTHPLRTPAGEIPLLLLLLVVYVTTTVSIIYY